MRKLFLFATVISLMAFSCEKDDEVHLSTLSANTCTVNNPVEELAWLKAEVQDRQQNPMDVEKYFYIQQAEYNGQTVFIYNNCCPMCVTVVPVYNCQGERLFYLSDKPEEGKKLKNTKILWKPSNFACAQ